MIHPRWEGSTHAHEHTRACVCVTQGEATSAEEPRERGTKVITLENQPLAD